MRNLASLLVLLAAVGRAQCTYSLNPASGQAPASGGSFGPVAMTVLTGQNCTRTVTSDVAWIAIGFGQTGTGNGTFNYSVDPNTAASRAGTITAAGQMFAVTQAAPTVTVTPTSASFPAAGGADTFTVSSNNSNWQAQPNVSWMHITQNASGFPGTTRVAYRVDASSSPIPRDGSILVGAVTLDVHQAGVPCTVTLSSASAAVSANGGVGSFTVSSVTPGCTLGALPNVPWIFATVNTINNTIAYNVTANPTAQSRSGAIAVADQTFTITQAAGTPDPNAVVLLAVKNAASYQTGAVSPGEFVVLGGTNIGPPGFVFQTVADNRFGTAAGNTRVLFDGVAAPLYYAGSTQTVAIVPYAVYGKALTQVQVEYQGVKSNTLVLNVTDAAPGIFTQLQNGLGAGSVLNQDFTLNTAANPAPPGSVIMVYGTGEGQTNPGGQDGLLANAATFPMPLLNVSATVGGVAAAVVYGGAAPTLVAGVFQINVIIPDAALHGIVSLAVQIGARTSQTGVTVAVQ
ncbi:MAG TPA: hypothetical protein VNY05_08985 [Candidatus Acidoferrales bacterium]|nr:hypothetical protein [Candidatus Acidoferrales bacterium]